MWPLTLYVETRLPTWNHGIVSEYKHISLSEISDNSSLSELMELTVLDDRSSLLVIDSWGYCISHTSPSEGASLNEACGIRFLVDARCLVLQIVFDALDRKRTALEDESSWLNQNEADDLILVILAEALDARVALDHLALAVEANHLRSATSLWGFFIAHATDVWLRITGVQVVTFVLTLGLLLV